MKVCARGNSHHTRYLLEVAKERTTSNNESIIEAINTNFITTE